MFHLKPYIRENRQEAQPLCCLLVWKKQRFEHTVSSLHQNQGVISKRVESEADHSLRFVHMAPQSGC